MNCLGSPAWLCDWALSHTTSVVDYGHQDILVVGFGLVRSVPALRSTLAKLHDVPARARLRARVQVAHGEEEATLAEFIRVNATLRVETISITTILKRPNPTRECANWLSKLAHRHATTTSSTWTPASALHVISAVNYGMAHSGLAEVIGDADVVILWRIDTKFVSPLHVGEAPQYPNRIFVPWQQHGGYLNDRLVYGTSGAVRRFQEQRQRVLATNCTYGEPVALAAAIAAQVEIGFTRTNVVRVRADLFVPDVDKAVLGRIRPRSWMTVINRLSLKVRCTTVGTEPACVTTPPLA